MPAALNQNPLLTLDALAPCGVVLPTEVSAALDVSLNLKARELGVQGFLFWGRLSTLNGKDYYVARAYNGTKRVDGKVIINPGNKFYYSQDGVNWLDLEPVTGVQAEKAAKLDCESPSTHHHHHRVPTSPLHPRSSPPPTPTLACTRARQARIVSVFSPRGACARRGGGGGNNFRKERKCWGANLFFAV